LPPDVNEAGETFVATAQGIRFAMTGIKGVGTSVVETILEERKRKGPFENFYQFFKRIDTKKVGKKVIESLVEAGCFDFTGWQRESLIQSVEPMYENVAKEQKEAATGILSLFSLMGDSEDIRFSKPPPVKNKASKLDILLKEKELLGFFLSGHPMDAHGEILKRLSCIPLRRVESMPHETNFRTAFIVESVQVRFSTKTQKKFAILTISDGIERFELPIWPDLYEEKSHLLRENQLLYAVLQVDKKEETPRLICRWFDDLTQANEAMIEACDQAFDKARRFIGKFSQGKKGDRETKMKPSQAKEKSQVLVTMDLNQTRLSHILRMKDLFRENKGDTPVRIEFISETSTHAFLHIDSLWGVDLTEKLKEALYGVPSVKTVNY
jgi:DNA polymerase-3 subunit alpha